MSDRLSELGWKYLYRWQDGRRQRNRRNLKRSSLEFEEQWIPLIQANHQDQSPDKTDLLPPLEVDVNMVNFSNQPDEIIVSEKRNHQHEVPLDPLDMDTEKPYMSHLEQQQPTEGHSLGAMSTRDTEKGTGYASSIEDGGRHEITERAEKKLLRKLGTLARNATLQRD